MALPYPEGEVYFKRSVLAFQDSDVLIEWVWNEPCPDNFDFTYDNLPPRCTATRSDDGAAYWRYLPVMFGDAPGFTFERIKRLVQLQAPDKGNKEYKKRAAGGPAKVVLTPVELVSKEGSKLPWMWIDLMFPVRAVYFPLQQKPSKHYPDLCTYLMVDFRLRNGVKIVDQRQFHMGDSNKTPVWHDVPFDNQTGLGMQPHKTIGLDIPGIYNFLILPRQMRSAEKGLYQPSDPGSQHDQFCVENNLER